MTYQTIKIDTKGGYTLEQINKNKNCSKDPKYWYQIEGTDRYLFKSSIAESWEFWDSGVENPIRNTNQIYIKFLDITPFIEPSNHFKKFGYYTAAPPDTLLWNRFWDDLEDKIDNGFEVGGVRITGRHFFFINFGRFRAIPTDEFGNPTSTSKIWTFLRFLDHQYYLMHELEECFLEGYYTTYEEAKKWFPDLTQEMYFTLKLYSFVVAKGRRKGWTAAIAIGVFNYNFTFKESSMNILAAYEKGHYGATLKAFHTTKTFLDKYTPWKRRTDIKGTSEHMIAGIETTDPFGIKMKEGYLSEMQAVSFKDNPFKGIGESATVIDIEEGGKFNNLLESYPVSIEPLIRDGETMIGSAIVGGTAGDMESGGSLGLSEFMSKPKEYGFKYYENIYEPTIVAGNSGWFIDDLWYSPIKITKTELREYTKGERLEVLLSKFPGEFVDTVDIQGNSYRELSKIILENKREKRRKISTIAYQKFITQQPMYLSEAFLLNESSPFDTATAKEVLGQLSVENVRMKFGTFALTEGLPRFILNMGLNPVDEYPYKGADTTGCWVIYEDPMRTGGEIPAWRYIAGCDPIDWGSEEVSSTGAHSFAASYIIDTVTRNIVAEYISRPKKAEDYFEQLWRGLEYFNAFLLYENNLKALFSYFKSKNKLYLLANEPESLKGRWGYKASQRTKGFHATPAANSYARELIHTWTLEQVLMHQTEDGTPVFVPRMYFIQSKGLLQEIISWNSKGNFDRISSLGATMILLFDKNYETDTPEEQESKLNKGIFLKMRNIVKRKNEWTQKINYNENTSRYVSN